MITAKAINARLEPPLRCEVLESIDSTNLELIRRAKAGESAGSAILALEQLSGRGQSGHSFHSPSGGLYMSVLLRSELPPEQLLGVTPAAAVAVARAIERVTGLTAGIKWVNDIVVRGRKVCGILTEALTVDSGLAIVCGVGINLVRPPAGYPAEIRDHAAALYDTYPGDETAAALTAEVLNGIWSLASRLPARDFLAEYRARSTLTGTTVRVRNRGEGTVLGIDEDFRLLVKLGRETIALASSGELEK